MFRMLRWGVAVLAVGWWAAPASAWILYLDGGSLPNPAFWNTDLHGGVPPAQSVTAELDADMVTTVIRVDDWGDETTYSQVYTWNTPSAATLAARLKAFGSTTNWSTVLRLFPGGSIPTAGTTTGPRPAVVLTTNGLGQRYYSLRDDHTGAELANLGLYVEGQYHIAYLYASTSGHVKLSWDGVEVYNGMASVALGPSVPYHAEFGYSMSGDRWKTSGGGLFGAAKFDWVGLGGGENYVIPEPATLMLLGLASVGIIRRRR